MCNLYSITSDQSRSTTGKLSSEEADRQAKGLARAEQDKLNAAN